MTTVRVLGTAALAILTTHLAQAQERHDHDHAGAVQVGSVVFPSDCAPAAAQQLGGAVALLHSFWYEEAERAFGEVIRADSVCALGYWGRAQSRLHPLWAPPAPVEVAASVEDAGQAVRLSQPGSRARAYADAIAVFFPPGPDDRSHAARIRAWSEAVGRAAASQPQDEEAQIFFALSLLAVGQLESGDTTFANQRRAAAILEPIFARRPDHPGLAHYLIHAFDTPGLAPLAVGAAQRYAAIAPAVPHAQHMPSHIFIRLGRWDDAIASNLRSAESGRQFEELKGWHALWDQRAHAWDYLEYAYLQLGRVTEARAVVRQAAGVTRVYPEDGLVGDYALAAIPARYALERNRWDEASRLPVRPALAWRAAEAVTHFARALGAARRGDGAAAQIELDALSRIEEGLTAAGGVQAYWAVQVRIQRLAASAWRSRLTGDSTGALREAREAADLEDRTEKHPVTPGAILPARELYGDLLVELGRPAEAIIAYEMALQRQPGRARSIAGLQRARQRAARQPRS